MEGRAPRGNISVEPISDPFPRASFGSIGRFVKVECDPAGGFILPRLTISYREEDLGWVDPSSLRVFEVIEETGEFNLVFRSVPDPEDREVHAYVERSGIYGLIGLPRDEDLLRAIRALATLLPPLGDVDGLEVADLLGTICGRILCVEPGEAGGRGDLVPPGGFGGDVCEFCLGREIPRTGLPEFQLLPPPKRRPPWGKVPPADPVPAGPYLLALFSHRALPQFGVAGDAVVEVVDLSTMSFVQTIQAGAFQSTGIASTPSGLCLLDWDGGQAIIRDSMGGKRFVPVGPYPGKCVASPDGSRLYVSTYRGLAEVDVAAGMVTRTYPASGIEWFKLLSISPDGRTLAVGAANSSFVYLFDTATLMARRVTITDPQYSQTFPESVRLTDSGLVLVWNGDADRMYTVDAATATQLPGIMDDLAPDMGFGAVNISYAGGKRGAYVTRGIVWSNGTGTGELIVVDVPTSTGSLRGGFSGAPAWTVLDPRDGKTLYISVDMGKTPPVPWTLDAYDVQADSFTRDVYSFRNVQSGGIPFTLWEMTVTG